MANAFDQFDAPASPSAGANAFDQFDAPAAQPRDLSWTDVASSAAKNFGSSARQFGANLVQPFIHPLDTAEGLKNVALGSAEKVRDNPTLLSGISAVSPTAGAMLNALPPGQEHEVYPEALGRFFADRYGGIENVKHTLANDPVGFAADLSTVLSGGETALARAPGILGKVGEIAGTVGRNIDPLTAAAKPLTALADTGPAQRALSQAGTSMTPGQMLGGYFKSAEDAATSIPLLGDFIQSGRARSIQSFNKSVGNQALEPIGESLSKSTKAGHDLVDEVESKIGDRYDSLFPKINFVPDAQYGRDLLSIASGKVATLPDTSARQFDSIMNNVVGPPAPMNGEMFKKIESELTAKATNYSSSALASERDLGSSLNDVVKAMRSNLERSNPAYAADLANANSAWAMYSRIRGAAGNRRTSAGVFTPSDLLAAIKSGDKSVRKGSFALGDALMQTFAEAGQKVLPSTLPDSGTARRAATMAGLGGASYLMNSPEILAGSAVAAAPYTAPGMWAANRVVAPVASAAAPYARPASRAAFQVGRQPMQQGFAHGGKVKPFHPQSIGARKAKDGRWYVRDKSRPGKFMMVVSHV